MYVLIISIFPEYLQKEIIKVKPGLSGIGSIVFRNEEEILDSAVGDRLEFYDRIIAPYKGELEKWFVNNKSLKVYFLIIFTTIWVVLFPKSRLHWKLFKNLPPIPEELKNFI